MAAVPKRFDLLVLGGGSAGMAHSRRAASYGANVCLFENSRIGGTCVNVGCVPKKVMWNAAFVYEVMEKADYYGVSSSEVSFNWKRIKELRDAYVLRLNGIYDRNLEGSKVTKVSGTVKFTGPKTVECDGETYTADHITIATGGRPRVPDIEGKEFVTTSDGFFDLEEQPKRVVVVGGGYIGVELAGVLRGLGSDVSLYVRSTVLRTFDEMIRTELGVFLDKSGIGVHTRSIPDKITKNEAGELFCHCGDETKGPFDCVLYAIGRDPNTDTLGLDLAGVELAKDGTVKADEFENTSAEGVYALGDVNGKVDLTPVAIAAGRLLADRLFGGKSAAKMDYEMVPTVVFAHPPIGVCGLTEEQAKVRYGDDKIKVYNSKYWNMFVAHWPVHRDEKPHSKCKLVCVLPEERVVGLHIIGQGADEMLQGFGVAMKLGATKVDFDSCVAIHPTASEEVVTCAPWTHRTLVGNEPGGDDGAAAPADGAGAGAGSGASKAAL